MQVQILVTQSRSREYRRLIFSDERGLLRVLADSHIMTDCECGTGKCGTKPISYNKQRRSMGYPRPEPPKVVRMMADAHILPPFCRLS